jgi:hypothetical protein
MYGKNSLAPQPARLRPSAAAPAGHRSLSPTRASWPTTCCPATSPAATSARTGWPSATTKPTPAGCSACALPRDSRVSASDVGRCQRLGAPPRHVTGHRARRGMPTPGAAPHPAPDRVTRSVTRQAHGPAPPRSRTNRARRAWPRRGSRTRAARQHDQPGREHRTKHRHTTRRCEARPPQEASEEDRQQGVSPGMRTPHRGRVGRA